MIWPAVVSLSFPLLWLQGNVYFVAASTKSSSFDVKKKNKDVKVSNDYDEHQSDISKINEDDIKLYDELGHYHHLPQQTLFDKIGEPIVSVWSSTSPPQISIEPSPVTWSTCMTSCPGHASVSTDVIPSRKSPKFEACVTETSAMDFLTSHALKPSLPIDQDISVMTGHLEMHERTDTLTNVLERVHFLSQPSTELVFDT